MIGPGGNNIGLRTDRVGVPYVAGEDTALAYLRTGYYHVHGESFLYPDKASPVTLTSAAGAWAGTGVVVEIIPAGALGRPFDLHWCSISTISAELDGVIDFFSGPADDLVKICSVDVERSSNFSRESALPMQVPQLPAGTRISARFTDSTTSQRTVRVKIYGHFYGNSI